MSDREQEKNDNPVQPVAETNIQLRLWDDTLDIFKGEMHISLNRAELYLLEQFLQEYST